MYYKKLLLKKKKLKKINKSGKYRRHIDDWIRLCAKCHGKYDKENNLRPRKSKLKKQQN